MSNLISNTLRQPTDAFRSKLICSHRNKLPYPTQTYDIVVLELVWVSLDRAVLVNLTDNLSVALCRLPFQLRSKFSNDQQPTLLQPWS